MRRIRFNALPAAAISVLLAAAVAQANVTAGTYVGEGGAVVLHVKSTKVKSWVGSYTNVPCQDGTVASGTASLQHLSIRKGRFAGNLTHRTKFSDGSSAVAVYHLTGHFMTKRSGGRKFQVVGGSFHPTVTYYTAAGKLSTVCSTVRSWFAVHTPAHR